MIIPAPNSFFSWHNRKTQENEAHSLFPFLDFIQWKCFTRSEEQTVKNQT